MAEQIDIYDANLNKIGTEERIAAHKEGKWHRTFHLWIVSGQDGGRLLFQLRSPTAKNYPNLLDVTAAGHLQAGEDLHNGIREVSEELGVSASVEQLHWLGYRVEVADQDNGQLNREYQGVFLLKDDRPLEAYQPDPGEVYGLIGIPITAGMQLFTGKVSGAAAGGIAYNPTANRWSPWNEEVKKDRFLPRVQNYYLTMLIMAERLLEGRHPLGIS